VGRDEPYPDIGKGRCPEPCGKVRFASRKAARRVAARFYGEGGTKRAYRCASSPFWHLTTASASAVASFRERAAGGAA